MTKVVRNKEYKVIELNKDQFNFLLNETGLSKYLTRKSVDLQVKKCQTILKNSDEIVLCS